ncbi:Membrane protein involved in the export of O-antigen and teichoic acid [Fontibacillus panacisegetis]|uniref:Membrane protein involved in the export of O-antigen and teichoic acid n=1 Tax=Fontibacillus panacisegetis TaxID=670482 RepID=A0A1G7S1X7_9BACL|nr:oligosaccharide flippase family protein [Fontibacillus panacisegetis]SDG16934.1 Membrane protein involved in the export of O-antigen and teichoic acid [Fontibacillus panacisegetis]
MKSSNDGVSSGLLKGAAVLSVAAIITKLLGTLQKIPLQNIGGDGVFGIYNTVYPFYTILITLATAGFPTVVSKFVAERHVLGGEAEKREVLRVATGVMALLGIAGSMTMYFGAPFISRLIGSSHLVLALRSAAPALLFIPLSASLRGYFQGLQDMMPTAVSQVIEQAVRVTVMIVLLLYLSGIDAPESLVAGGALAGSAAGGAAGLIVVLLYWRKYNKKTSKREYRAVANQTGNHTKGLSLLREMLYYAIPVCLAALAVPLISLVDTFTLPRLLTESSDELGTMIEVGVYNRGIPLVQLVTMLASSLSVLFIPVLAEMNLRGDREGIRKQSGLALKWFWLIGLASSTGLAILAEPINIMLYEDGTGTNTMIWIAWTAAPSALVAVTAALLQGLGVVRAPALNLLAAAAIKTALNVLLVPQLGITGAAIAGIAAYTAAAALNLALLLRQVQLRPRLVDAVLRPLAAVLAMSAAVLLLRLGADAVLPHGRLLAALESLLGVLLGAAVFAAAVLRTRLLSAAELAALPRIGPKLLKALRRMHLLR